MKNLFLHVVLAHFAFAAFADPSPDLQNNKKEAGHYQTESYPPLKEKSDINSLISAISNYFYPKKSFENPASPSAEAKSPLPSSAKARNPASAKRSFRRSFAPAPQVVFFQKKNGHLVSKCQVSVERYPEILPPQLEQKINDRLVLANRKRGNNTLDLKLCGPNLSLSLANKARHFGRKTQTAAVWTAIGVLGSAALCGIGGFLTYEGVRHISNPKSPLKKQVAYGQTALSAGGSVLGGAAISHQLFTVSKIAGTAVRLTGAFVGAFCSVAGGAVGYIHGKIESHLQTAKQEIIAKDQLIASLKKSLARAKQENTAQARALETARARAAKLEQSLARAKQKNTAQARALKTAMEKSLTTSQARVAKLEQSLAIAQARVAELEQSLATAQARVAELRQAETRAIYKRLEKELELDQ